MKKVLVALCTVLCISVMPSVPAQAAVLSSQGNEHSMVIKALGWLGSLPVWFFLPYKRLINAYELEAIFGPRYSDVDFVYEVRCLGRSRIATEEDIRKVDPQGHNEWGEITTQQLVTMFYGDYPDCQLGRSQTLGDRMDMMLRVVGSSDRSQRN